MNLSFLLFLILFLLLYVCCLFIILLLLLILLLSLLINNNGISFFFFFFSFFFFILFLFPLSSFLLLAHIAWALQRRTPSCTRRACAILMPFTYRIRNLELPKLKFVNSDHHVIRHSQNVEVTTYPTVDIRSRA